jgi:hypothetical protein
MKHFLTNTLQFLQLTDKKHHLSLTNLAVIIVLYKLAFVSVMTTTDLGTMLLALLAKAHERHLTRGDNAGSVD